MIPNPIRKVLSTFQNCEARALLMGEQACVFYGGAEFSRDTDFAVPADAENLARITRAAELLEAEVITVPPFELDYLLRGHAVHFRCHHPEAARMRVDVMARMRGVAPFQELWERRTTLEGEDGTRYELLSLPDLVAAKKTQRDKDWPMIRRLIEADVASALRADAPPSPARIRFWLSETRSPDVLRDLCRAYPAERDQIVPSRPLLALIDQEEALTAALQAEESTGRALDRAYWAPLRRELEDFRRSS
ncbi:MAG: hypothetical protein U1F77_15380 [Kiritimatiellia bacterium]